MEPLLTRVDQKRRDLLGYRPLPPDLIARVKATMDLAWVHTCHAWGGGTLRAREVAEILATGLAVADRPVSEHVEVLNLAEAVDWVEEWARTHRPLKPRDLRELHAVIHQGVPGACPGRLRTADVGWAAFGRAGAPGREVPRRLQELCSWVNGRIAKMRHPIVRAAYAYSTVTTLMPFREGNDVVGRFLLNGLLLQRSYPIAVLDEPDPLRAALRYAQTGETVPLVALVGEAVEQSLDQYLNEVRRHG